MEPDGPIGTKYPKPAFPVKTVEDRTVLRSKLDNILKLESDLRAIEADLRRCKMEMVEQLAKKGSYHALSLNMSVLRQILR